MREVRELNIVHRLRLVNHTKEGVEIVLNFASETLITFVCSAIDNVLWKSSVLLETGDAHDQLTNSGKCHYNTSEGSH